MSILYSYYRSSCSYRVRIALAYKDIPYEYKAIHLMKDGGEQFTTEYSSLNPQQQVPYWIDDRVQLGQSMAICLYLDSIQPNPSLFFQNRPLEFVKIMELCEVINSGIQPLQNLSILKRLISGGFSEQQKTQWICDAIHKGFVAYEKILQKTSGDFSVANTFSAADCFLIPQIYNAHRFGLNLNPFSNIKRIEKNCLATNFVQKAKPEIQPDMPK